MGRLFGAILISGVLILSADRAAEATCSKNIKRLAASLVLCSGVTSLTGCKSPQHQVLNTNSILSSSPEILSRIDEKLQMQDYRWVLHIHFRPNDFPILPGNERLYHDTIRVGRFHGQTLGPSLKLNPLPQELPTESRTATASPLFQYSPFHIGDFEFYYDEARSAEIFVEKLLEKPAEDLHKIFLIVSAGSHGSSSADSFIARMKNRYGKNADMIVMGDAIAQPFFLPKWIGNPGNAVPINFYQRNDFLAGAPISGFYNIRVAEGDHVQVSDYSENVGSQIARSIDLSPDGAQVIGSDPFAEFSSEYIEDLAAAGLGSDFTASSLSAENFDIWITRLVLNFYVERAGTEDPTTSAHFAIEHLSQSSNILSRLTAYQLIARQDESARHQWRERLEISPTEPAWIFSLPSFKLTHREPDPGSPLEVEGLSREEKEELIQWVDTYVTNYWSFTKWQREKGFEYNYLFVYYQRPLWEGWLPAIRLFHTELHQLIRLKIILENDLREAD